MCRVRVLVANIVLCHPLQRFFNRSLFVNHGTCESRTPVHGFIESYSTASIPRQDIWNVSCAGGWTAGNYVGSVADVARYVLVPRLTLMSTPSTPILTHR